MLRVSNYNYVKKYFLKNLKKTKNKKIHKKLSLLSADRKHLNSLNQKGYCIVRNVFSKRFIDSLRLDFAKEIKELKNISCPRDLRFQKKNIEQINLPKLDEKTFFQGEKKFKNFTDSIKLKDPLINLPRIIKVALNKRIISICSNFFGCIPYLTFLKCVKTFKNQRKEHDTQHFHIDENSVKLLKVFIYLNDVNSKKDGPFYYVKDSFKNIKEKWGKNARWNENYLKKEYGVKKFKPLLAKRGDIIIANTVAFHRGIKPIMKNRNIIILNYGMHVDFTFNNKLDITSKILKRDISKLTKKNKSILSLLKTVN